MSYRLYLYAPDGKGIELKLKKPVLRSIAYKCCELMEETDLKSFVIEREDDEKS